jgi:hypothetical protein
VAQQPNIELDPADLPRRTPEPAAARRWAPSSKPGVIVSPDQVPRGGAFGSPGPDTGWAFTLIRKIEPNLDPDLEAVLVALMAARAALKGRAPVPQDLEVAKLLAGMHERLPTALEDRRTRWTDAVPHERSKGRTAVSDVSRDQLAMNPDELLGFLTNHL